MNIVSSQIRALNAVVEEGSFTAASRALGMSQPAVSQAIKRLESQYGIRLFETKGKNLIPTEFCLELADITEKINELEQKIEKLLQRGDVLSKGTLKIGLGNSMPGISIIGKFKRQYPDIRLDVKFGNYSIILQDVMDRNVDVGILPNVPDDDRLFQKVCLVQKVVAIVPTDHPLASQQEVKLSELTAFPLIYRSKGSSTQKVVDEVFNSLKVKVLPELVLESRDGVCEAVANGLGIGFLWDHGTSRQGDIVRVPIREFNNSYSESAFRRRDQKNKIVDAFFLSLG